MMSDHNKKNHRILILILPIIVKQKLHRDTNKNHQKGESCQHTSTYSHLDCSLVTT